MNYKVFIEEDKNPPVCPECQEPLAFINLKSYLSTVVPPILIDTDKLQWVKGLGQYNVSPGWTKWQEEGYGYLETSCPNCSYVMKNIRITDNPSGFVIE